MPGPGPRPLPAALLVLTCLVALASVPVSAGLESVVDTVCYPLNAIGAGLAGYLIVTRRRTNPIGWVLSGMGIEAAVVELTEGYAYHSQWPWALPVEWITNWASFLGVGSVAIVLALFPSGRDLGVGRRIVVGTGIAATALMTIGAAFGHSSDASFAAGVNPYAIDGLEPVTAAGEALFIAALLASIGSLILRYYRSTGIERQQLKWVAYVVTLLAVVGPTAILAYDDSVLVQIAIAVVVTALPAAICIAILRYRLYDIDIVVNRTLVYATTTALLAAVYAATVLVLGAVLGGPSPWVTAAATLTVAVAFRPLRDRVQDAVDRRFRRARHAALTRVDRFLKDLRTGRADPDGLQQLLRDVTSLPDLQVCYLLPEAVGPIDGHGRTITTHPVDGQIERRVERAGVELAMIVHGAAAAGDPHLLDEIVDRAGLAIEIARLRAEVHHRLAEVEASRARIVTAGYEERRRLERDLHDGAQQRLVSAGLALRHVQYELGDSPAVAGIDVAVEQITVAISDLRELANGIRPAYLDDGLDVALRELAERTPLPVDVHGARERFPVDVEATAYFVACEALTNAVKHSAATQVEVRVERRDNDLVMTIRDDGVGGARHDAGTGLRGLSDRVAAAGGRIDLESRHGAGTTLTAQLPCAS